MVPDIPSYTAVIHMRLVKVEKEKSEEPAVTSGARTTLDRSIFLPAVISTVTVLHTITARGSSCSDA